MTRAFYDLRADQPTDSTAAALLQRDGDVDRDRRAVERAHRRNDDRALTRALARLHHNENRTNR
jgi:hypothetical protein